MKRTPAPRMTVEEIVKKYPHVVGRRLRFNARTGKQAIMIRCQFPGCSKTRWVFTSDLFQVQRCDPKAHATASAIRKPMPRRRARLDQRPLSLQRS